MKLRRNKKGFTIIELVIVIAVIGILAAVLIPTFVNLTNKANEASDNALVNNLNKALKMEEQEPGHEKSQTLEGAIKDLEKQGYILENLASKSGKDLLWSQSENQFLLNTDSKSGKDYWKIVDAVPAKADQKYSYYAGKNFNQTDVTVKYGFDAGRNDNISKVTYEGTGVAQEVAIRTNGLQTSLEVQAGTDVVHHYNSLDTLNITAVAPESYHEHGVIKGTATISQGHFVVEKNAQVSQVNVKAATGAVKVTTEEKTAIFVDNASKANTSVVLNAENVKVSGADETKISGDKKDTAVKPVVVNTYDELDQATYYDRLPFVQLGSDIDIPGSYGIYLRGDCSFDLNGKTLNGSASAQYSIIIVNNANAEIFDSVGTGKVTVSQIWGAYVYSGSLTVNGGTFEGAGEVTSPYTIGIACADRLTVNGGVFKNWSEGIRVQASTATINNVEVKDSVWGVTCYGNGNNGSAKLTVNGCNIHDCESYGISGNGTSEYAGTDIEIHGGYISAEQGIYHPQNGTLTIDGNVVVEGETALYIKSGIVNVKGGKFIATLNPKAEYNYYGNGSNATGDAIVIDACGYPGGNASFVATISDASFVLADASAKKVAHYSHGTEESLVYFNGQLLTPVTDAQ